MASVEDTRSRMDGAACGDCVYWDMKDKASGTGECRRKPPSPFRVGDGQADPLGAWPETYDDDWCGEFVRQSSMADAADAMFDPGNPNNLAIRSLYRQLPVRALNAFKKAYPQDADERRTQNSHAINTHRGLLTDASWENLTMDQLRRDLTVSPDRFESIRGAGVKTIREIRRAAGLDD